MNRTALLAALPFVFTSGAAFAEATDEGAAHLVDVFQTYLGTTEGVVAVEVDGDSYTMTVDVAPLTALAAEAGTASLSPLVMTLTDNEDGTWAVSQDQAMSFSAAVPGALDMKMDIASFKSEGVFDEALMTFSSSKSEMSGINLVEKITDPNAGDMNVEMTMASGTYETTGVAAAAGGVDSSFTMTMSGLSETVMTPAQEGMPAMPFTLTAESMTQSGKIDGLRPDAMYQALAWVVAHPTEEEMMADKAGLKGIIEGGMPFFAAMTTTSTLSNLSVVTPMGNVGIAEMGVDLDANGLVAEGKFREAISVKGLTLPEGIIPPWAVPILPKEVSFDFQVTDFDPAAAVKVMLGLFDLPEGAEPDAAFEANLLAALMPNKTVTIGLNPGAISGDGYALTYEGSMVAGPEMPVPTGKALLTLTGLEVLQAALDAAPDEIKGAGDDGRRHGAGHGQAGRQWRADLGN